MRTRSTSFRYYGEKTRATISPNQCPWAKLWGKHDVPLSWIPTGPQARKRPPIRDRWHTLQTPAAKVSSMHGLRGNPRLFDCGEVDTRCKHEEGVGHHAAEISGQGAGGLAANQRVMTCALLRTRVMQSQQCWPASPVCNCAALCATRTRLPGTGSASCSCTIIVSTYKACTMNHRVSYVNALESRNCLRRYSQLLSTTN